MKDFITKMMCLFLLLMIGTWSVKAQTPMQAEHITANDSYMQGVDANEASYAPVKRLGREPIYDNGPMVTHPGAGPGGTDYSALHAGENILATGFYQPSGLTLADDFTLEESVSITEMEFYGIQQGSTTSSIFTGVYVEIYDGPPNEGGTKIFGDMTTNRIISSEFSGIYRTTSDLSSTVIPIMRVVADVQIDLPAGTYWVSVATTGQALSIPYTYGNPCSSPEGIVVGNGLNYSSSGWIPWIDSDGTGTRYALPFKIHGTVASGGEEPMYDTYAPPTNVTASATGNNVKVSWKAPEGVQPPTYAGWLTRSSGVYNTAIGYTGGFNTGQVIECYARFTPDELMDYEITNRNKISQFSWYGANGEITAGVAYKVKIYQGGSVIGATVNPGTLVYEQDIPAITAGAWNDIALTTPVSIDVSKELWFGISITITSSGYAFIMTLDNAGDADYTKNLVNMDGGWSRLYDLASSFAPYNWMTRAYIVDANGKGIALGNNEEKNSKAITYYYLDQYEVYCNDALVGITTGTNFVHQNAMLKDGALNYCVKSVFNDGGKSEA
ncbi:MAG: hypothetical protein LBH92_07175, partial [Bacteroidales bacterium]|nr:hypothetical protein [Bacteroidales bacterium]